MQPNAQVYACSQMHTLHMCSTRLLQLLLACIQHHVQVMLSYWVASGTYKIDKLKQERCCRPPPLFVRASLHTCSFLHVPLTTVLCL